MANALQSLLDQLDLEQIETNLFRGISEPMGPPRVSYRLRRFSPWS